jgi:hypothetical protein
LVVLFYSNIIFTINPHYNLGEVEVAPIKSRLQEASGAIDCNSKGFGAEV